MCMCVLCLCVCVFVCMQSWFMVQLIKRRLYMYLCMYVCMYVYTYVCMYGKALLVIIPEAVLYIAYISSTLDAIVNS